MMTYLYDILYHGVSRMSRGNCDNANTFPVSEGKGSAGDFYRKLGFEETGVVEEDKFVMRLLL